MDKKYDEFFKFIVNDKYLTYEINNGSIEVFNENMEKEDEKYSTIYIEEPVDYIPPNTSFYENISMSDNNDLKKIGINFDVDADLHILSCENLESVGRGLRAVNLYIDGCHKFNKLPDNTKVLEKIKLEDTNIQEFGKNIKTKILEINDIEHDNYSIKNMENLEAQELFIYYDMRLKNINKIKNLKRIGFLQKILDETSQNEIDSIFILDNETTEGFLKTVKKLYINMYRNYLDFKSPNSLCSKLINEEYNLITENDIQECILSNNNREVLIGENKIPVSMIDYCVGPKGILYLKKAGYEFTKEELKTITDSSIKSNYENALIEKELKMENEDKRQYQQTAKQIKKSF